MERPTIISVEKTSTNQILFKIKNYSRKILCQRCCWCWWVWDWDDVEHNGKPKSACVDQELQVGFHDVEISRFGSWLLIIMWGNNDLRLLEILPMLWVGGHSVRWTLINSFDPLPLATYPQQLKSPFIWFLLRHFGQRHETPPSPSWSWTVTWRPDVQNLFLSSSFQLPVLAV